jgi:hypothetical protein
MMRKVSSTPLLFAMPGNEAFARRLADGLDAEHGEIETQAFPDLKVGKGPNGVTYSE